MSLYLNIYFEKVVGKGYNYNVSIRNRKTVDVVDVGQIYCMYQRQRYKLLTTKISQGVDNSLQAVCPWPNQRLFVCEFQCRCARDSRNVSLSVLLERRKTTCRRPRMTTKSSSEEIQKWYLSPRQHLLHLIYENGMMPFFLRPSLYSWACQLDQTKGHILEDAGRRWVRMCV